MNQSTNRKAENFAMPLNVIHKNSPKRTRSKSELWTSMGELKVTKTVSKQQNQQEDLEQ